MWHLEAICKRRRERKACILGQRTRSTKKFQNLLFFVNGGRILNKNWLNNFRVLLAFVRFSFATTVRSFKLNLNFLQKLELLKCLSSDHFVERYQVALLINHKIEQSLQIGTQFVGTSWKLTIVLINYVN